MFDITPDDISKLDDEVLRELVGRLAAAELVRFGQSPLDATWGGKQTAADGGLDVRVALPVGATTGPNIPRQNIGYQVKKSDMPRGDILKEMRPKTSQQPKGDLRPTIAELAAIRGAYIIVSANGSTSDASLRERRKAMRDALTGCQDADHLHTDFYDRTRLATWVREHSGLLLWAREQAGRSIAGWRSWGNWSNPQEASDAPYLIDDRVRMRLDGQNGNEVTTVVAIQELRRILSQPKASVRLVGLSGVGKTRFVQALFDPSIGNNALPREEAVYTDFHEQTSPQPEGMAADLLAQHRSAIVIIDNCGSATHGRLTKLCQQSDSRISLLSVEYDVREDIPEDTNVVIMDTASESLIEELVLRRSKNISRENAHTIAAVSGGNARIALAISHTVRIGENLAGLRSEELFERLFMQRHGTDDALLRAAEACALVYSFEGVEEVGEKAQLPVLARLAGMGVDELHRHIQTLRERELVQTRSAWRAVMPHALANYLAAKGLHRIRTAQIRRHLVEGEHPHLLRSFAHRLSYMIDHPAALAWCEEWIRPNGILGEIEQHDYQQHAMFSKIASVVPDLALAAIERGAADDVGAVLGRAHGITELIRLIAWDEALFDRCVTLLIQVIRAKRHRIEHDSAQSILISFCQPNRSGTHATVARRLTLMAEWLEDSDEPVQTLGRMAIAHALSCRIHRNYKFNFGVRKRDSGYYPRDEQELADWFIHCLALLSRHAKPNSAHADWARQTLSQNFPKLWVFPLVRVALTKHIVQVADGRFWRDGWLATREAQREQNIDKDSFSCLQELEMQLAPSGLEDQVLAAVLGGERQFDAQLTGEGHIAYQQRLVHTIREFGRRVANDLSVLHTLAPKLLVVRGRIEEFGGGLALETAHRKQIWDHLVKAISTIPLSALRISLAYGYLAELTQHDRPLCEQYLDQCASNDNLAPLLPALQAAVGIDERGLARVRKAYDQGRIHIEDLCSLRAAANAPEAVQQMTLQYLGHLTDRKDAVEVVINALHPWLNLAEHPTVPSPLLTEVCQRVLTQLQFAPYSSDNAFGHTRVAKVGLRGPMAAQLVATIAGRLRAAIRKEHMLPYDYQHLIELLVEREPEVVLTTLVQGDLMEQDDGMRLLAQTHDSDTQGVGLLAPQLLVNWCAEDPTQRLPFVIGVIPVVKTDNTTGVVRMTPQALGLLKHAAAPIEVLDQLVERIETQAWSNSKAITLERNASALDEVLDWFDSTFQTAAVQAKERLLLEARERLRFETDRDRAKNETFE